MASTGRVNVLADQEATGQVRYMATLPNYRGQGIGTRVLDFLVDEAGQAGLERLELNARPQAVSMYQKAGFVAAGDLFDMHNIPHLPMTKLLI